MLNDIDIPTEESPKGTVPLVISGFTTRRVVLEPVVDAAARSAKLARQREGRRGR